MTEAGATGDSRRITLTVDADSYTQATVDIAVAMAASLNARLHGLFVEDSDLLRMADLPCSMEITFPFARQRTLDRYSLQRSLRALGTQVMEYLAKTAERSHVQWSFNTISGKGTDVGLSETGETELLIIGLASTFHAPAMHRPGCKRILLIDDHSPSLLVALDVILEQNPSTALEIVMIGARGVEPAENIGQFLQGFPDIAITRLESNDIEGMINLVGMSPDYVIVPRNHPLPLIQKIVHESFCPVILVT